MGRVHETNGEIKGKPPESAAQVHSRGTFLLERLVAKNRDTKISRKRNIYPIFGCKF